MRAVILFVDIPWLNAVRSFSILSIIMILLTIGLAVVAYIKEPFLFAIGPTGSTILQGNSMIYCLDCQEVSVNLGLARII